MSSADHWLQRIQDIEREKAAARDRIARRSIFLTMRLAERRHSMADGLRAFEASDASALMRVELGKQRIDGRVIQRSYEEARETKQWWKVRFPVGVLLIHRLEDRFFAYTHLGLTEFRHCYRLWSGNGLMAVRTNEDSFASTYVDAAFPHGVSIPISDDDSASALDLRWMHISDADWECRVSRRLDVGADIVTVIASQFDDYLRQR